MYLSHEIDGKDVLHRSVEEVAFAISYGADALRLVSEMPSNPGVVSDELAAEIA